MSAEHPELGSGEIEHDPDRTIVHFGSPAGTDYTYVTALEAPNGFSNDR